MSASTTLDADIAAIRGEFATLQQNMSNLVDEIKRGAVHRAQGAADQINGAAHGLFDDASDQGERTAKALGQWVKDQPVAAVLIALGVGYVGARVFLR